LLKYQVWLLPLPEKEHIQGVPGQDIPNPTRESPGETPVYMIDTMQQILRYWNLCGFVLQRKGLSLSKQAGTTNLLAILPDLLPKYYKLSLVRLQNIWSLQYKYVVQQITNLNSVVSPQPP
jgi:hypothetical protein